MDIKNVAISNEKNVTSNDILCEANKIWSECKKIWNGYKAIEDVGKEVAIPSTPPYARFGAEDHEKMNRLFDAQYKSHPEFGQSYPTVLRHMVQDQYYDSAAFKMYLNKLEKRPWTNDSERMDSYTEYYILLYKKTHPKYDNREVNNLRDDYRRRLQKSHDDFLSNYKKIEEEILNEEKRYDRERRDELVKRLRQKIESGDIRVPDAPANTVEPEEKKEFNKLLEDLVNSDS